MTYHFCISFSFFLPFSKSRIFLWKQDLYFWNVLYSTKVNMPHSWQWLFILGFVIYCISAYNKKPTKITMIQKAKSLTQRDGIWDLLIANNKWCWVWKGRFQSWPTLKHWLSWDKSTRCYKQILGAFKKDHKEDAYSNEKYGGVVGWCLF